MPETLPAVRTIGSPRAVALLATVVALTAASAACAQALQETPAPTATVTDGAVVGVASFNMAWAGTMDEFRRHVAVCSAPDVNWCDTRARWQPGTTTATPEEEARAKRCLEATFAAAGGRQASAMVAPCNAYRSRAAGDPAASRSPDAYAAKLAGLRATVERLVERDGVSIIAFQEVSGKAAVEAVLGRVASRFDVCAAAHTSFQTVAFAWDRKVTSRPGVCTPDPALAVSENPSDPADPRRARPGLALELTIHGTPVTFLDVHLKAGCANIVPTERYPARLLTDSYEACEVFNRQVPILESWIEAVAARTPRLVWLGDFNRRIDEEAEASLPKDRVRADGSDPAGPNAVDAAGKVATRYLWPEIADGSPVLHQVPLSTSEGGCTGFTGLDHVVISDALWKVNPAPIPSRKEAVVSVPGQVIETSDHCPWIVQLRF